MTNLSGIESRLLQQVDNEIPSVWYENIRNIKRVALAVSAATIAARFLTGGLPIFAKIASGVLCVATSVADRKSTLDLFATQEETSNLGFSPLYEESSPLKSGATTGEQYKSKRKITKLALEGTIAGISTLFPEFGFGFEVGRVLAIMSNKRNERRLNRLKVLAEDYLRISQQ